MALRAIEIDEQLAQLLGDVIDMHVEGVLAAKNETTEDPTIVTVEELLELMSGYDNDLGLLMAFRKKLRVA